MIQLLFIALAALAAKPDLSKYKFLPVTYTPQQQQVVNSRLGQIKSRADLPAAYEINKSLLPKVRDQGYRPTCAYFATLGALEAYYLRQSTNQKLDLSEECLVGLRNWMYKESDYVGDDRPGYLPNESGDWPFQIAITIENNGVPKEGKYAPMDCRYKYSGSTKYVSLYDYPKFFNSDASAYGKDANIDLNWAPTMDDIRSLISKNIPVEIAVLVFKAAMNTPHWRYKALVNDYAELVGAHAFLLTGYKTEGSSTVFTFKNSWGSVWGKSGYGTIDDQLIIHGWSYDPNLDFILTMPD